MVAIGYAPFDDKFTEINLPLSKSISNRLLILNFLSGEKFKNLQISNADDSVILLKKLKTISANIGYSKFIEIDVNNAGTAMRFLTSLLSVTKGKWLLTGNERMQQRPVKEMVDALISIGANIEYTDKAGFPPLKIEGSTIDGGEININSNVSSQFITSLLLIAPFLKEGLKINLIGNITSYPYILMTLKLLDTKGVDYEYTNNKITVHNSLINSKPIQTEHDWSSAAYWYEMVAFASNLTVKLTGLKKTDIQGDAIVSTIFKDFGVFTEFVDDGIILSKHAIDHKDNSFDFDFTDYPDLAQTIAVTCAGLGINAKLTGLGSLKIKETDRLQALYNELIKINCQVEIKDNNQLIILSSKITTHQVINTYNDHRMIMSFAPLAMLSGEILFDNIDDVSKSYPNFWEDVEKIGLKNLRSVNKFV